MQLHEVELNVGILSVERKMTCNGTKGQVFVSYDGYEWQEGVKCRKHNKIYLSPIFEVFQELRTEWQPRKSFSFIGADRLPVKRVSSNMAANIYGPDRFVQKDGSFG